MADQALQQLAAATPTASGHAQAGTSSQKVHGPTDSLQVVTVLERLGITHGRHLQEIQNQMTLTIWIYDDTMQTDLQVTRQAWVDSRLQGEPHPSGMSQRVVMWCKLINALRQAYAAIMSEEVQELSSGQKERVIRRTGGEPSGWEAAVAHWGRGLARTQSRSEIAPSQIEQEIFRLKPTFREPLQGKPWIWNLVSTAAATLEFKQNLAALAAFGPKPEQIHVAPGRVRDGPIICTLTEWLDTQPKGKGRNKGKNKGTRGNHRRADNEASMGMDALGDGDGTTQPTQTQGLRSTGQVVVEVRHAGSVLHAIIIHHLLLCATGGAWRSAEPCTAVGSQRGRTARLRSVQPPRRSGGGTVRAPGSF